MKSDGEEFDFAGVDAEQLTGPGLQKLDTVQLDEVFSAAPAPAPGEMGGRYRGLTLAGAAHDFLPSFLKKLWAAHAASPLALWKGKEFEGGEGEGGLRGRNLLFNFESPVKFFDFTAAVEPSVYDGADCLVVDYSGGVNPLGLRGIRYEMRRVNPELFLSRATLEAGGRSRFVVYFCLEPE